jgi:predicted nucleic acid-binding protein
MKDLAVVDSSVWIELLGKGKLAKKCAAALQPRKVVGVPALVVYEVCRKVQSKISAEQALSVAAMLRQYGILDLTDQIALLAVDLSLEHNLPMADSIVLAHAREIGATLLTMDNDFAKLDGVLVVR